MEMWSYDQVRTTTSHVQDSGGSYRIRSFHINENTISATMSRYILIVVVPLMILWPIWGSWVFTPCAFSTSTITTTTTTTIFDTFILTSTIPPTAILTVTSREEYRLRRLRQNQEFNEKLARRKLAWQQEREARAMEELWERKMRDSWSVWFMDYLYHHLAYFLVAYVALCMVVDWDVVEERRTMLLEQERERERLQDQCRCL